MTREIEFPSWPLDPNTKFTNMVVLRPRKWRSERKAAEVYQLRTDKQSFTEIGKQLKCSRQYAHMLYHAYCRVHNLQALTEPLKSNRIPK